MREIGIGILGCGVVGTGTVELLVRNADDIARRVGARLVVRRIAVRDIAKQRPGLIDRSLLTDSSDAVLNDPSIDIVAELVGGVEPARAWIGQALRSGKSIVTANKELMAKDGRSLIELAAACGRDFFLEGSVAGGIPILSAMQESLAANRVDEVLGIVNGTTNYILTRMTEEGADFAEVLADAQRLGYAEADPSSDVDGDDARYKIAILASIAFNTHVGADDVHGQGIRHICARDIAVAKDLGYRIKLLAVAQQGRDGQGMQVRVHPALLPLAHPLASVNDVFNAVLVRGDGVGDVMFFGRGAGSLPTGSAVVGDLISCARNILSGSVGRIRPVPPVPLKMQPLEMAHGKYYVRLHATDKPKVLASIASVFGDFDVSIESVVQRAIAGGEAEIVWITHRCREESLKGALEVIGPLESVRAIHNWIRVEE